MNKKDCNCCCWCCCENQKNDWGYEKEYQKCCYEKEKEFPKCGCHQEKEFPKYSCHQEKEFPKCGCTYNNNLNKNYDYGFGNQSKNDGFCDCQKNNYGYSKYDQKNFGWY